MEKSNKYAKYFSDKNEKVHMNITAQITFIDTNKDKTHTFKTCINPRRHLKAVKNSFN